MCEDYDPEAEDKNDSPTVIRWKKDDEPADFKSKLEEAFGEYGLDENDDEYIIKVDPDAELKDKALGETRNLEGMERAEEPIEEVYRAHCLTRKEEMLKKIEQLYRQR